VTDLEANGHLVRIKEEVDPELEMAAIHLRVHQAEGPAILFERVKGSDYAAVSNMFGTMERSKFMFRDTLDRVREILSLKSDPLRAIKSPLKNLIALKALPRKLRRPLELLEDQALMSQLPQIKCWPNDGGPYVLLPQVYTEDVSRAGVMGSNLGCYRIQMGGNNYVPGKEVGLHYQIHRGIGVHQARANEMGQPLKVSIFVGGPPAHIMAAIMPLPEGVSELTFAGLLNNRRFRYGYENGHAISADADFVITGEVHPHDNKPEGPFGDHLGYYSLTHDFPVMKVNNVYAKKNAIWPFTVVGRPPQEDTQFGKLIHELTGPIIPTEIPGLHAVQAVDATGVHPLLLALGSERYTPYVEQQAPQELLTIANHILGFGQMSLAKYLFIADKADNAQLSVSNSQQFIRHMLERVDWTRDLHFYTNSTIDTLDYSGTGLNAGSKLVIAAVGESRRVLSWEILNDFNLPTGFSNPRIVMPGVLCIQTRAYVDAATTEREMTDLSNVLSSIPMEGIPLIVIADDSDFVAESLNNFLWVTFTRSNPAEDVHGVNSFIRAKHWGCEGSMIVDARVKPHHAPMLELDPDIEKRVDALGVKGGALEGVI